MSVNGLMVTVVGWAATTPREVTGDGVPYTSFRVATTPRRYDVKSGGWTDGRTEWITVKAFREAAYNVAASVRKGDPLVLHGRMRTQEWVAESGPRTDLVLDVSALGHDLTRGRGSFARSVHVSGQQEGAQHDAAQRPTGPVPEPPDADDPWAVDAAAAGPDLDADPGAAEAVPGGTDVTGAQDADEVPVG